MATLTTEFKPVKNYAAWNALPQAKKLAMWQASVIEYPVFDITKVEGFTSAEGEKVLRYNGEGWLVISQGTRDKIAEKPELKNRLKLVRRHALVINAASKGEPIFQLVAPGSETFDSIDGILG